MGQLNKNKTRKEFGPVQRTEEIEIISKVTVEKPKNTEELRRAL